MFFNRKIVFSTGMILLLLAGAGLASPPMAGSWALGPTSASKTITTSIILNIHDRQELANFIQASVTPGDSHYHQFLTVEQFRTRFAPSDSQVQVLVQYLKSYGITVNSIYPNNLVLSVTGSAAQLNAVFATQLQSFVKDGQRFHRPAWKASLPGALGDLVLAVPGLDSEVGRYRPMMERLGQGAYAHLTPPPAVWPQNGTATGIPQEYTVGDVANFYQVNPLYQAGIKGQGRTVGILTLANFNASDVEAYWSDIGLKVKKNRITKVLVDGGTPVQPGVGDDETSLDVEQSGGLAPLANIRVYIAPNTTQGVLDELFLAVTQNKADTISTSWGLPEEFYFAALNGGEDFTFIMQAMDEALMEAAAQGQSVFAAAGDSGAYDVNRDLPLSSGFSAQLTVDSPANDPFITAAGGTTLNTTIPGIPQLGCPSITFHKERVWGWDYLQNAWGACLGLPPNALFAEGSGGGVSSFWALPWYQLFVSGITQTQPGQSLVFYPNYPSTDGAQTLITLPAYFAGRNLPDISLNADPETGYVIVDCTDYPAPTYPGCAMTGYGGTSFVAPQLNGITALIDQASGSRVGLLNPVIYTVQSVFGYGKWTPFNDIKHGDNWFYHGVHGYDNGSGIGTLNATNLALTYVFLNSLGFGH